MSRVTKLFNIDIKSVNEADRQITFCFSDDAEDRMGEIVDQASWDTKNYMNNPLILWGHDPSDPENVLGQGVSLDLNNAGKSYITAQFDEAEINPRADMVFRQLIKRTLRCVSAGFINHTYEHDDDTPVLKDNELLEVSIVPIPANPRAVALALKDGSLSKKDAQWLMTSMSKEAAFIEKQLATKKELINKDNQMTEEQATALQEQNTALMEAITKLGETVAAQATKLDEVSERLPAVETEEDKTAREAKELAEKEEADKKTAADKEAADKAAADKKAAEDAEAKRVADEEEANKGPQDDDELTPEVQAQIDAEIAEQSKTEE